MKINHYLLSVIVIGLTVFVCTFISDDRSYYIVAFILLFIVSLMSTFMGIGPVLLMSTLSALVWNFFFIPPIFTFHIGKTEDILIFGMFFTIALVNGVLTTRIRRQQRLAKEREVAANALYKLSKRLSEASGVNEVIAVASEEIELNFAVKAHFRLADFGKDLNSPPNYNNADKITLNSVGHKMQSYPLKGTRLDAGVIIIDQQGNFPGDRGIFWDTFLTQISNSLEKEYLGEIAQRARILDESDKLFKTLFNSISHELRIPVSTIMGAADTLLTLPNSQSVHPALYKEIFSASVRLNRLIENLLSMSRLESGRISPRLLWCDINDLVSKIKEELKEELVNFTFKVTVQEDMPLVKIDFGLMEQVLYNLVYNSCEYIPYGSTIWLNIFHNTNFLYIKVFDNGPGFPESKIENAFNRFFRVKGSKTGGLGLGLSIVKGFVEAHKGTVQLENCKEGGALFTIKIPSEIPELKI